MGDRVLGENGYVIGIDQLRQPVVYFRVNVIRTARKYDSTVSRLIQETDGLFPFSLHILAAGGHLRPGFVNGGADLALRDGELAGKLFCQPAM